MANQLDVYREWLGITETARPLNYYQLLRLSTFEDNVAKIRANYRKMNAHVRKFAAGEFAAQSQAVLNELAKAMLCLTDADRKREYDATLGRKDTGTGRRRSFEEILLANRILDQEQLAKARNFSEAVGLSIRDAVVQQKLAAPDVVMTAYAEAMGLPYVELEDVGVDEQVAASVPASIARQHSCVPVMIDRGQLLMASPNPLVPDVEEELRLRFDMPVRSVLCTAAGVNQAVAKYFPRDLPAAPLPKRPAPAKAPAAQAAAQSAPEGAPAESPPPHPQAPPQPAPSGPVDKERRMRELMVAVTAFALTNFLAVAYKMLLTRPPHYWTSYFLIVLPIALIVGGIGMLVARKLNV